MHAPPMHTVMLPTVMESSAQTTAGLTTNLKPYLLKLSVLQDRTKEEMVAALVAIPKEVTDDEERIWRFLVDADKWSFNIFDLDRITQGHPLYYIALYIVRQRWQDDPTLPLDMNRFKQWLLLIESNYHRTNPYHNAIHAADVTQSLYFLLTRSKIQVLDLPTDTTRSVDHFAAILSAIVHDFQHPGYTTGFMLATSEPIALRYNDSSALENFHAASSLGLLKHTEYNFLEGLAPVYAQRVRTVVISNVLATDLRVHFNTFTPFTVMLKESRTKVPLLMVYNIAIKVSDIGNPTKTWSIYTRWTDNMKEEQFRQGDEEKRRGLPLTPFADRNNCDLAKWQLVR